MYHWIPKVPPGCKLGGPGRAFLRLLLLLGVAVSGIDVKLRVLAVLAISEAAFLKGFLRCYSSHYLLGSR